MWATTYCSLPSAQPGVSAGSGWCRTHATPRLAAVARSAPSRVARPTWRSYDLLLAMASAAGRSRSWIRAS
eukprot:4588634-Lingulodinium_polyedra.AAC.1